MRTFNLPIISATSTSKILGVPSSLGNLAPKSVDIGVFLIDLK